MESYPEYVAEPFRPSLQDITNDEIKLCMVKCWAQEPNERPDFHNLKNILRKLNK